MSAFWLFYNNRVMLIHFLDQEDEVAKLAECYPECIYFMAGMDPIPVSEGMI